jgi:hypothetical protein
MLDRIFHSKTFVSFMLASGTWFVLILRYPFPADNLLLQLISLKDPIVYGGMRWTYMALMFTTPFILYSSALSSIYIFAYRHGRKQKPNPLPPYPEPASRNQLFLVTGEQHHMTKFVPSPTPHWITTPPRGLYAGTMVIGAVGSGKTSCVMLPFADQLIGFEPRDMQTKLSGLVLEVKGDFCHQIKRVMKKYGREEDYVEISLDSEYRWNPLYNDLDAYALAYGLASLLTNLFGRGKEPFWQQAYTNLVKFVILLHKVVYDYVTLFDVYECSISPDLLQKKIQDGEKLFTGKQYIRLSSAAYRSLQGAGATSVSGFTANEEGSHYEALWSASLENALNAVRPVLTYELRHEPAPREHDTVKREQFEAVKRWFYNDWTRIEPKLRTSIVEGISVFLSLFDDSPPVKRVFCPRKETYDPALNTVDAEGSYKYGKPLPSFNWLIENGKVCALNFPISLNAGLARAIGTMMKMDFQRAVLLRIPKIAEHNDKHFRPVFFLCDEYQTFATVGESDPSGDEKFFSLSRQAKCIAIVATQSISSLRSTLPGESYRTLLQTFRTKIFLALSDEFSTRTASELCGQEDKPFINYTITESGQESKVSILTGTTTSERDSVSASKNYSMRKDFRFPQKVFAELANAQAIVIPYNGFETSEATICYLKPHYLDPNISYFEQAKRGLL